LEIEGPVKPKKQLRNLPHCDAEPTQASEPLMMVPVCTRTHFVNYDIHVYKGVGFLENECNLITTIMTNN